MGTGKIVLKKGNTRIGTDEYFALARETDGELAEKDWVYTELRGHNFTPRTGYKFGHHFRVYCGKNIHSDMLVHAVEKEASLPMSVISRSARMAHSVKKKMLFGAVHTNGIRSQQSGSSSAARYVLSVPSAEIVYRPSSSPTMIRPGCAGRPPSWADDIAGKKQRHQNEQGRDQNFSIHRHHKGSLLKVRPVPFSIYRAYPDGCQMLANHRHHATLYVTVTNNLSWLYLACETQVRMYEKYPSYCDIPGGIRLPTHHRSRSRWAAPRLQSGEVTYDAPVQGTITNEAFSQDWTFTSAAADRISVRVERLDGNLVPSVTILDNNQQEVAQSYGSDNTYAAAEIPDFTLPLANTYTIRVGRQDADSGTTTGNYQLTVTALGAGEDNPNNTTVIGPVTFDTPVTGEVTGQHWWNLYTLDGEAGQLHPGHLPADQRELGAGSVAAHSNGQDLTRAAMPPIPKDPPRLPASNFPIPDNTESRHCVNRASAARRPAGMN